MFKNLTKTVLAFSALVFLLAGCGSDSPEPVATTPAPPTESVAPQEPASTVEVDHETPEPAVDDEWITRTQDYFSLSFPGSFAVEESGESFIAISRDELLIRASQIRHFSDFYFWVSYGMYEEEFGEAFIRQEFVFDDGTQGVLAANDDEVGIAIPDGGTLFIRIPLDGDRSIFTDNEDLILRIARSLTSASPVQDGNDAVAQTGNNIDQQLLGRWDYWFEGYNFSSDGTGSAYFPGEAPTTFTWETAEVWDSMTGPWLFIRFPDWTRYYEYTISGNQLHLQEWGDNPSRTFTRYEQSSNQQGAAASVGLDINHIENLLITNYWSFSPDSDGHGFNMGVNAFAFINFFQGGTGTASDWTGMTEADFTWGLIDDVERNTVVLNIFSGYLSPDAASVGLWYTVSLSTLGAQQILTLQSDHEFMIPETVIITAP